MRKLLIIGAVAVCALLARGEDDDDAYTCAGIALPPPPPTPEQLEARTQALLATVQSIPWDDTNTTNLFTRKKAIERFRECANTNIFHYLSTIWHNPEDPAQLVALKTSIGISLDAGGDEWKDMVVEVSTNQHGYAKIRNVFALGDGTRENSLTAPRTVYIGILMQGIYRANQEHRAKIEAFIDERLPVAKDNEWFYVDQAKFYIEARKEHTNSPSYWHSRQRRDNLIRARDESVLGNEPNTPGFWNKTRYEESFADAQPVE